MDMETRSTDAKGRICLPRAFANATVIIDHLSDTELRIRKAVVIPQDEVRFDEETAFLSHTEPAAGRLATIWEQHWPCEPNAAAMRRETVRVIATFWRGIFCATPTRRQCHPCG
jgi:hypothetical protein